MQETRRMADQAKRMGEDALEQAGRMGGEFQKAAERGFEAASQSFSEANRGFQAFAAEMTDYSKRSFDDAIRTREGARYPIPVRQESVRQPHGGAIKASRDVHRHDP